MIKTVRMACLGAAVAAVSVLTACGGGGGGGSLLSGSSPAPAPVPVTDPAAPAPAPAPVVATASVPVTVMDGLIAGATVCLDVNGDGQCETGDILAAAATDANGNATIAVPEGDVGKYPVVVVVPVGAVDADSGPVTTAYTLSAPADKTAVVSPLTTAVQFVVASTGVSSQVAADTLQSQTGLPNSPFANYVAAGDNAAANAARVLVAAIQNQSNALGGLVGQTDSSGTVMAAADIQKAIMAQITTLLSAAVVAGSDSTVVNACADKASAACKNAVDSAAGTVVTNNGLTASALAAAVALSKIVLVAEPSSATPTAGFSLDWINVGDANNWYTRIFTWSAAEDTPDSAGLTRNRSIRHLMQNGVETVWANNNDPLRTGDLHWNGSAWVACTVDTLSLGTIRDAQGRSTYNFCDGVSKGTNQRVSTDITGKTMPSVFTLIQGTRTDGGNWGKAPTWFSDPVTASVGGATFPSGSKLHVQSDTTTENSITYDVRDSNILTVRSAAAVQGGDPRPDGLAACYSDMTTSSDVTLELLVARATGKPCLYFQNSFAAGNGATYSGPDPELVFGGSTFSLGNIGTSPLGTASATSYFSGNTGYRVAFDGGNSTVVTFLACPQAANASASSSLSRNCAPIGKGSYAITTLGDARVMTLSGFPVQMAGLTSERVFVERGGKVYYGFKSKLSTSKVTRLNGTAGNAVLSQLGLPTITP